MNDQPDWIETNELHLSATLNWLRLKLRKMIRPAEQKKQEAPQKSSCGWFKRDLNILCPSLDDECACDGGPIHAIV